MSVACFVLGPIILNQQNVNGLLWDNLFSRIGRLQYWPVVSTSGISRVPGRKIESIRIPLIIISHECLSWDVLQKLIFLKTQR